MFFSLINLFELVISSISSTASYLGVMKESILIFLNTSTGYQTGGIFVFLALLGLRQLIFFDGSFLLVIIKHQLAMHKLSIFSVSGFLTALFACLPAFIKISLLVLSLTLYYSVAYYIIIDVLDFFINCFLNKPLIHALIYDIYSSYSFSYSLLSGSEAELNDLYILSNNSDIPEVKEIAKKQHSITLVIISYIITLAYAYYW